MGRKYMPLSKAVLQKEITFCFECGDTAKIEKSPYNLLSVTSQISLITNV